MQQLVATVIRRTETGRRTTSTGLSARRLSLRVRVEGPVEKALAVPDRVKGREMTIVREVPGRWGIRRGDTIVLSRKESARALCPRRASLPELPSGADAVRLDTGDIDRDGFEEDRLSNAFVEAVLKPHRGARLASLRDCGGVDRFAQPFEHIMAGKYVLLGGAEDLIFESGSPGKLWNAALEREQGGAGEAVYGTKLKSPAHVRLRKRAWTEPGLPGVITEVRIRYDGTSNDEAGRESADEDRTAISYGIRLSTAVTGTASRNVFDVPGPGGVKVVRYVRPPHGRRWRWRDWRDESFGLRGGFLISRHEVLGRPLMVLFSARRALCVGIRNDLPGPEVVLRHRTVRLRADAERPWGAAFLSGDASCASGKSALLLSRDRTGTRLAVSVRTARRVERIRASLLTAGGRRRLTLRPVEVPYAGHLHTGVLEDLDAMRRLACRVRVADDVLRAALEDA
ncbi:MAG: hypothetical protein GF405_05790 [Candidatus Eisenbacteria bacterium]|nr:hypothetical protein [Candidatus Eisenbacteria bacterium]